MSDKIRPAWPTPSGAAPEALQDMLDAARQDHGNAAQVERLLARLGPTFAPPTSPSLSGRSASGSTASSATLWKGAALGLTVMLGGAAVWWVSTSERAAEPPTAQVAVQSVRAPSVPLPSVQVQPAEDLQVRIEPDPKAAILAGTPRPRRTQSPSIGKSPSETRENEAPHDTLKAEAELLHRGKAALAYDAQLTLQITDRHMRLYPKGLLVEERQTLAVQSLVALGKLAQARALLAQVERAFPHSAHTAGLRALLEQRTAQPEP